MGKRAITQAIEHTVLNRIGEHRDILVAYSGGIDSTVLVHALVRLKQQVLPELKLTAIYIHHGISTNADDWAKHCQQQCQLWQIPCVVEKVSLRLDQGNIEAQARAARYAAIAKHFNQQTILCTAQHLDDQCETFLLALKRGSGPAGLSAMPEQSLLADHLLLRPLLTICRHQIEQYAQAYHLQWIEDESNQDDHYDRNFLRLNVLPLLNQRWPHFSQMVVRSAELCQLQEQLLNELLAETLAQLTDKQKSLSIQPLLSFSAVKRNALLRMWLKCSQVIMPSRKQLAMIWQTVILAREDSNPTFLLADKQIRRYQNRLYLLPRYQDLRVNKLIWQLTNPLILPDNVGILSANSAQGNCRLPHENELVSVRFSAHGQLQIVGRNGSRSIKKLWQELNIPPWMRSRIPLIFYNETLITAVGVFVTQAGKGEQIRFIINDGDHSTSHVD